MKLIEVLSFLFLKLLCLSRIFGFVLMMCGLPLSADVANYQFLVGESERTQHNTQKRIMINDFGDG